LSLEYGAMECRALASIGCLFVGVLVGGQAVAHGTSRQADPAPAADASWQLGGKIAREVGGQAHEQIPSRREKACLN
jgi:hypothetical protein